jgi:hypothetical protein
MACQRDPHKGTGTVNLAMTTFGMVHTLISLVGIVSGFVVVLGMFDGKRLDGWTAVFLLSTVLTSATGFGFPFGVLLPSHKIGIISLVVLALAIVARYVRHLAGGWRRTYVISAVVAFYFNCFVLVVQLFRRVTVLQELAPTQSEPPFAVAQVVVLVLFIWIGIRSVKRFHPA